nr:caspase family protein [Bacteroidales bacterium]
TLNAQNIENVRVKKLNKKLNIFYDITNERPGQLFNILVYCSVNGGGSFPIQIKSAKGDIFNKVSGGKEKLIIWDVLKDVDKLESENVIFKIIASPQKIELPSDELEGFAFILKDCKRNDNKLVCKLNITNKGKERDLKFSNLYARIYDFNNKRYDASSSIIGRVRGSERYSKPQLKFAPNQSVDASFTFNIGDELTNRLKLIEFTLDVMEISYGIDLTTGTVSYRDISVKYPEMIKKTEKLSHALAVKIVSDIEKSDDEAPIISLTYPKVVNNKPIVSNTEDVSIKGIVKDESKIFELTINGFPITLSKSNNFETSVYLAEGKNNVYVRAIDEFGNSSEKKYSVVYVPLKKQGQRYSDMNKKNSKKVIREGKYYALIMGINEYSDPLINNLGTPISDAEKLSKILIENYSFNNENVKILKNPSRERIISELDKINKIVSEKDNFLIYYAGHGYWENKDEIGYWLPSDSKQENTANWLRNSTLRDYLRTIDTKHTLLIADACFSGGIFKERKSFRKSAKPINELVELQSRKAMTSGSLKEVPDKSVFLLYLTKRLKENTYDKISAEELFNSFHVQVINNSSNTPLFGEIKGAGDEGGGFIFVKRK